MVVVPLPTSVIKGVEVILQADTTVTSKVQYEVQPKRLMSSLRVKVPATSAVKVTVAPLLALVMVPLPAPGIIDQE